MQANGEMLRVARQLKGFQQTEAAKRLGIDQSLLSRMENGVADIREELLSVAERVFEVRRSFFFQTDRIYGAPVSVHPMWRRKADVSARDMDMIVAEMNVRAMHLRRFLEAADVARAHDLPRLDIEDYEDADRVAGLLRAHWMIPRGPIKDLTVLVERAGVVVVHSSMGGAAVSGVTFSPPGLPPMIVLNSDQPADRMRFTLAHELGHIVMHRFPSPNMEEEASTFASSMLLPSADIGPLLKTRKIDLQLLAALKPEWKVSMQCILMKAKSLGLLSRNQEEYLWKQISARKWRLREPPELDFPVERPTVIRNLVDVFRVHLGYSNEELSKLLHVFDSGLDGLYPSKQEDDRLRPKFTIIG
jgi:Zn-dependent peptidase ImmA (M78 family)/DNA-binding XRE family transcriptional regulator